MTERVDLFFNRRLRGFVRALGRDMPLGNLLDELTRMESYSQCRHCGDDIILPRPGIRWVHDDGDMKCWNPRTTRAAPTDDVTGWLAERAEVSA